jgi:putative component of membrane protein insertase Oxa1/YidC/SpoIIIJ protein YidD
LNLNAQSKTDLELLKTVNFKNSEFNRKQVKFGISGKRSPIAKYNPVTLTFSSLMFIYQKVISPQISADCLFSPTCSEFSRQLIIKYGFPGFFFTADRLMRCHRISATTFNPVSIDESDMKMHEDVSLYSLRKFDN